MKYCSKNYSLFLTTFLFAFLFTVVVDNTLAQSAELGQLYAKKNEYVQQKDYKNALIWGEKMLAQAAKEFGTKASTYANYANDMGQLYFMTQQFAKALKLFEQAANIYKTQLGTDHMYYGVALNTIANVYYEQKQYPKALTQYEAAAKIYKGQLSTEHQYYTTTRDRLLEIYQTLKKYAEAEKLMEEKLPWVEKQLGKQHVNYAYALDEMAQLYKYRQKYPEAINYFQQAIKVYGKNRNYENQATVINNLGMLYDQQKNYPKAIKQFEQALSIHENQVKNTQSEDYMVTLSNLVLAYDQLGYSPKLEKLYLKLLELQKTKGNTQEYLINAYSLASYYQDRYQYKNAEKWYLEIIKAFQQKPKINKIYIRALNNLSIIYSINGQYAKAENLVKEGLQKQEKVYGKNHRDYCSLLTGLGDLYRLTNQFGKAEKTFLEAKEICAKVIGEKTPEYANVLNSLGALYNLMAQYRKSEKLHLESLALFEKTSGKNHPDYAMGLHNMGILYTNMGLYERAEKVFLQSQQIRRKTVGKNHLEYGTTVGQLGLLYFYMGIHSKAMPLYKQALKIKYNQYGKKHPEYANTLLNIGLVHYTVGRYNEAENFLTEALAIYEQTVGKNHRFYANCLQNLAEVYVSIGRFSKASDFYFAAKKTFEKLLGKEHPSFANVLTGLGKLRMSQMKFLSAGNYFYESMLIYEKKLGSNNRNYFTNLLNLRVAYQQLDSVKIVDKYFKNLIPKAEELLAEDPLTLASIYQNEALTLYRKKDYRQAEKLLRKGLKLRRNTIGENNQAYTEALGNLAHFYSLTQHTAKAKKRYLQYADHMLKYLREQYPSMSEKDKNALLATNIPFIEDFKDFAARSAAKNMTLFEKLFSFHIMTKGLTLSFSQKMRSLVLDSGDSTMLGIYQQWVAHKEYLAKVYQLPKSTLTKRGLDLEKLAQKNNELETKLAKKYQDFSSQLLLKKVSWQEIQQNLKPDELAIEVIRTVNGLSKGVNYGIVLIAGAKQNTPKHLLPRPRFILLKNGYQLDNRYLKYYRQTNKFKRKDKYSYAQYWQPIQEVIAQLMPKLPSTIYFSADGCYNQINLKTLQNPKNKQYLIDLYKIHLVSSSKEIIALKQDPQTILDANSQAILIGRPLYKIPKEQVKVNANTSTSNKRGDSYYGTDRDQQRLGNANFSDLPGTEEEVVQINQLLLNEKWQTTTLIGKEAREQRIKQIFNPDILHIATHGFFIPNVPPQKFGLVNYNYSLEYHGPMLRSGLILTGVSNPQDMFVDKEEQVEDGILTAYEATNLRLEDTKLVVLSACETGLGDFRIGEGVYGLQRAFKIAGAQNIVMSLWKVDDQATQELMVSFYKNLLQFNNLRKAFRKAQQQLKKKYPHPHFWGAFVLLGR